MSTIGTWFHANAKSISRGNGKTYVGAVAYITGERIYDEENKRTCYRGHPGEVTGWGLVSQPNGPAYLLDKKELRQITNAVQASEKRVNAQFSNHWDIALSREGTPEGHAATMKRIATRFANRYGVMAVWAVHEPSGEGSADNWHGHLLPNMRRITPDGFGEKASEMNGGKSRHTETEWVRSMIAEEINLYLAEIGSAERVSHLSYKERGITKEPTVHLGNQAFQAEKQGIKTKPGDKNREAKAQNEAFDADQAKHDREIAAHQATIDKLKSEIAKQQRKRDMATPEDEDRRAREQDKTEQQRSHFEESEIEQRTRLALADRQIEEAERQKAQTQVQADQGKRDRDELEEQQKQRLADKDIPDADTRWALALGAHYDGRRHFSSLANAATAEAGTARKEYDGLTQEAALAKDPNQREVVLLKRDIMHADYMALTSERLAGISRINTGNLHSFQSQQDTQASEFWRDEATLLRGEYRDLKNSIDNARTDQAILRSMAYQVGEKNPDMDRTEAREAATVEFGQKMGRAPEVPMPRTDTHMDRVAAFYEQQRDARRNHEPDKAFGLTDPARDDAPNRDRPAKDQRTRTDERVPDVKSEINIDTPVDARAWRDADAPKRDRFADVPSDTPALRVDLGKYADLRADTPAYRDTPTEERSDVPLRERADGTRVRSDELWAEQQSSDELSVRVAAALARGGGQDNAEFREVARELSKQERIDAIHNDYLSQEKDMDGGRDGPTTGRGGNSR